jgi:hypothetical protein
MRIKMSLVGLLLMGIACSYEPNLKFASGPEDITAQVRESDKKCTGKADCTLVNIGCCQEQKDIMAMNRNAAHEVQRQISKDCPAQHQANPKLCEGKVAVKHHDYPAVDCENNVCVIKAAAAVSSAGADDCQEDWDCVVIDTDCCGSRQEKNLIAINSRSKAGKQKITEKSNTCRKKRKDEGRHYCVGAELTRYTVAKVAKCVEKKCKIQ